MQQPPYEHWPPNPSYPPQSPPQIIYLPQPQESKPRDRMWKTLSIVFFAIGLVLLVFGAAPTYGDIFGLFAFIFNVVGFVFLCMS